MNHNKIKHAKLIISNKAISFINSFREIQKACGINAEAHGWWDDHPAEIFEEISKEVELIPEEVNIIKEELAKFEAHYKLSKLMLVVSEASEACEAVRKDLPSDHIPATDMLSEELADIVIRIMDFSYHYDIPLASVIVAKMKYNLKREYRHGGQKA